MRKFLSSLQRQQYLRDGVVFPIRVLTAEEADRYRAACDELEVRLGGKPRTVEVRQMHLHFRWAYELATQAHVLDAVEDVLGPNLLVWATELFAKHPQDAQVSIGWHRDRRYMRFDSEVTTTAWLALSDSTPENGCMRVVIDPDRAAAFDAEEVGPRTRQAADTAGPDDDITDVALRAGEMSLHDAHIMHGSGPNHSTLKRVALAIRYITPEAKPNSGRPPVLLVRGRDTHSHFEIVDPPEAVDAGEALQGMQQSAAGHLRAMLQNIKS